MRAAHFFHEGPINKNIAVGASQFEAMGSVDRREFLGAVAMVIPFVPQLKNIFGHKKPRTFTERQQFLEDARRRKVDFRPLAVHRPAVFDAIYNALEEYQAAYEAARAVSLARIQTKALEPLQKKLWQTLRRHAKGTSLEPWLHESFSVDRFDELMLVHAKNFLGENGVFMEFQTKTLVRNDDIIDLSFPFKFFKIVRRDPALRSSRLKARLEILGLPAESVVVLGSEIGPGFKEFLSFPPEIAQSVHQTVFLSENTFGKLSSDFEKAMALGMADVPEAQRGGNDFRYEAPYVLQQIAARPDAHALSFQLGASFLRAQMALRRRGTSAEQRRDAEIAYYVAHEDGHGMDDKDPSQELNQATTVRLEHLGDYNADIYNREVHRKISAFLSELEFGEPERSLWELMIALDPTWQPQTPDIRLDARLDSRHWIFEQMIARILDPQKGGPGRFGLHIEPALKLPVADQIALQMIELARPEHYLLFQELIAELRIEHKAHYADRFVHKQQAAPKTSKMERSSPFKSLAGIALAREQAQPSRTEIAAIIGGASMGGDIYLYHTAPLGVVQGVRRFGFYAELERHTFSIWPYQYRPGDPILVFLASRSKLAPLRVIAERALGEESRVEGLPDTLRQELQAVAASGNVALAEFAGYLRRAELDGRLGRLDPSALDIEKTLEINETLMKEGKLSPQDFLSLRSILLSPDAEAVPTQDAGPVRAVRKFLRGPSSSNAQNRLRLADSFLRTDDTSVLGDLLLAMEAEPVEHRAVAAGAREPSTGAPSAESVTAPQTEKKGFQNGDGSLDMTWLSRLVEAGLLRIWPGQSARVEQVRRIIVPVIEQVFFALAAIHMVGLYPRLNPAVILAFAYALLHTDRQPGFRYAAGAWGFASLLIEMIMADLGGHPGAFGMAPFLALLQIGLRRFEAVRRESKGGIALIGGVSAILLAGGGIAGVIFLPTRWVDGPLWLLVAALLGSATGARLLVRRFLERQPQAPPPRAGKTAPTPKAPTRREALRGLLADGAVLMTAALTGSLEQTVMYHKKVAATRVKLLQATVLAIARLEQHAEIYAAAGVSDEDAKEHLSILRSFRESTFLPFREQSARHTRLAQVSESYPGIVEYDVDLVEVMDLEDIQATIVHEALHLTKAQHRARQAIDKAIERAKTGDDASWADQIKYMAGLNADSELRGENLQWSYEDVLWNGRTVEMYQYRAGHALPAAAYFYDFEARRRVIYSRYSELQRRTVKVREIMARTPGIDRILRDLYEAEIKSGQVSGVTFDKWVSTWVGEPAYSNVRPDDLRGGLAPKHGLRAAG